MSDIEKFPLTSMDITKNQIAKLKQLFPEVFTEDNKIDLDKLKLTLGETIDTGKERYGMNWPGKADCFKAIQQPSTATLIPDRNESVNFDATVNLFIEGDNLEVLKLLQKSYLGKIKMIYIDPPYNTGNDFIYPDNYSESLETYLEYTGQVDSEGRKFSTNTDTDGRFHSKWMNMMYPRLFLAKNLLREDGVIFISIDDNEVKNLRTLCDEIFGEENFIADIIWEKRYGRSNDARLIASQIDHIIFFRKTDGLNRLREPRDKKTDEIYSNPDNDSRGDWTSVSFISQRTKEERPNLAYKIINPFTGEIVEHPSNSWKYSEEKFKELSSDNRFYWGKDGTQKYPRIKRFLNELPQGMVPVNLWRQQDAGTGEVGTKEVENLLCKDAFDHPKPTTLIRKMLQIVTNSTDNNLILDFFAGSATTAHAVLELNKQDGGNRKFICVQLPEPTNENSEAYKAGYKTIADIGKERIRRVIQKLSTEDEQKNQKDKNNPKLFTDHQSQINGNDLGFKVFKLSKSNFSRWNADVAKTTEAIQEQLFKHVQHISPEAEQEAILYELLLKSGFDLTTPIQNISLPLGKGLGDGLVFSIGENELFICLEKKLTHEFIKAIAEIKPQRVICLDEGFQNNDQLKTNAALIMKSKGVVKFQTV